MVLHEDKYSKYLLIALLLLIVGIIIYGLRGGQSIFVFGVVVALMVFIIAWRKLHTLKRYTGIHPLYPKTDNHTAEEVFRKELLQHEINKAKQQDINS